MLKALRAILEIFFLTSTCHACFSPPGISCGSPAVHSRDSYIWWQTRFTDFRVRNSWAILFCTLFDFGDIQRVIFSGFCRCFMEHQVLAEFVRVLKISKNSRIEAPLLQYLSIMIQNMDSEYAICKSWFSIILYF